jgi:GNAT superfamily N-acetyltransferase
MPKIFKIRAARKSDMPALHALIEELATYERAPHAVVVKPHQMQKWSFGKSPFFKAIVATHNGVIIGMAVYYFAYSTWTGPALYLEDLLVTKGYRRQRIGQMLFNRVQYIAKSHACVRLSWQVLNWNTPAIAFYKKQGATLDSTWINGRIEFGKSKNK